MAQRERSTRTWFEIGREIAVVVSAYVVYFWVRGLTEGSRALALTNAQSLIGLERRLGILWEPALQRAVVGDQRLVTLANWVYIWGHWPVIVAIGVWLYVRHPATYSLARNALLISGAIGLVIFATFPVAPPRLTNLDVRDTVTLYSNSYRVLQPPAFVNQYAAVPSLHFGWDLLIGIAAMKEICRRVVKLLCWLMPPAMFLAILLTANHYILDAAAGAVVALVGLLLAQHLQRRESPPGGLLAHRGSAVGSSERVRDG